MSSSLSSEFYLFIPYKTNLRVLKVKEENFSLSVLSFRTIEIAFECYILLNS